jgi:hypothetical protein
MKSQEQSSMPTKDELRAARIAGFTTAISCFSPKLQARWMEDHQKQDARREALMESSRHLFGQDED